MEAEQFNLHQLARQTGLDERVIRSYIQQELLRGSETRGRGAFYSRYHHDRLLAIRVLKERQGLSLAEVRRRLSTLSDEDIRQLAASQAAAKPGEQAAPLVASSPSALAYIRALRQTAGVPLQPAPAADMTGQSMLLSSPAPQLGPVLNSPLQQSPPSDADSEGAGSPGGPLDRLLIELRQALGSRQVQRRVAGESWFRLQVTPDVELGIRGVYDAEALARFERLADYLRQILLGGLDHDSEE